ESMLDFQKAKVAEARFEVLLSVHPFWIDGALLQALKNRWEPMVNSVILPLGHMIVSLEDVARITGLRVHGRPVTGVTEENYREQARKLLGYEDLTCGLLTSL